MQGPSHDTIRESGASEQAQHVAEEARRQTQETTEQVGGQIRQQAEEQQERLAHSLRDIADELSDISESRSGMVARAAGEAARPARDASTWLEEHEPRDLLAAVEDFARRRPVMFLASAAAAGAIAGRLSRSMMSANGDQERRGEIGRGYEAQVGRDYEPALDRRDEPESTGTPSAAVVPPTGAAGRGTTGTSAVVPPVTPTDYESDAEAARRRAGTETQEPM
jgi:hypothetical protein